MSSSRQSQVYSRIRSFRYALDGWWYVIRTQHNAWIHAIVTVAVVALGFWLHIPVRDWAVLILAILIVWMAEFMNTALEAVVDLFTPDPHPLAKVAKDVAAAAVLLTAIGSVLVGLLIMGPPLLERLF